MKRNVKKLLSENADQILPDPSVRDRVLREVGTPEPERERAYAHGGTDGNRAGKKHALIAAAALLIALVLVLAILFPVLLSSGTASDLLAEDTVSEDDTVTDSSAGESAGETERLYAGGAAGAAALLPLLSSGESVETLAKSALPFSGENGEDEAIAEFLSGYLSFIETMFCAASLAYEVSVPEEDYADYDVRMDITCPGLAGTGASYTMYYNETLTDSDGDSGTFSMDGVLLSGGAEYPVTGTRETETDGDDAENAYVFRAVTDETLSSCLLLKEESKTETKEDSSAEKTETEILFTENGKTVRTVSSEYAVETKDGETEGKLSLRVEEDGAETEAELKWDSEKSVLEVSFKTSDGADADFEILVSESAYTYVFGDEKITVERAFG